MRRTAARVAGDSAALRNAPIAPAGGPRVLREAILARVFAADAPSIVVLQAPAGHGKSTVLQQIRDECEARHVRCAWLHLDEGDNDGRRHSTHLQRVLRLLFGHVALARGVGGDARAAAPSRADWFVEVLEHADTPVALFVDEFEVLSDRAVLMFWRDLLLKLPPQVRVFIAARAAPDVGIPRLTVSDRILVLSARDLCFSEDEVRRFFDAHEAQPTPSGDIAAIHRCTEGWPAAIQLFRLGLSQMTPAEVLHDIDHYRPRELADYLTECVLDGLSSDVRLFLQRTSILNRMNAQVCNRLTGRSDSQTLLLRLEKQGLFVSAIDVGHSWFRYHSLFATQLREQLFSEDASRFRALHRQAAEWFHGQLIHDDAMHHAVAASDLPFAADILEAWSERLVADGELSIAERWHDCLPTAQIRKRPVLKRRLVWALAFLRQQAKLAVLVGDGEMDASCDEQELPVRAMMAICADDMACAFETITRVRIDAVPDDHFIGFELSAAANLDAFRHIICGDYERAERQLASAQARNGDGHAFFSEGYTDSVRGLLMLLKGRTAEAIAHLHGALLAQRRALDVPFATAPLACCYLWTLYEANRLDAVCETFADYREMVLICPIPDLFAIGVLATLRALQLRGERDGHAALLNAADVIAHRNRWPRIVAALDRERASRAGAPRLKGDEVASPPLPSAWLTFEDVFSAARLAPLRQLIRQQHFDAAAAELADWLALRPQCALFNVRLGVIKALLLDARGLKTAAARQFAATLRLAHDAEFCRAIIDEGEAVAPLLDAAIDALAAQPGAPLHAYAVSLRAALSPEPARAADVDGALELDAFSAREREIIECLRQRMSNREIARSAHISENTVKFHLKKIFARLGVRSRSEACARLLGVAPHA